MSCRCDFSLFYYLDSAFVQFYGGNLARSLQSGVEITRWKSGVNMPKMGQAALTQSSVPPPNAL